jgi:hypothetical protein
MQQWTPNNMHVTCRLKTNCKSIGLPLEATDYRVEENSTAGDWEAKHFPAKIK